MPPTESSRDSVQKGNSCSFRHDFSQSGKSTPKSLPYSEPKKDGKESSRKKNLRSRSPFGKSPRKPCVDHLDSDVILGILSNFRITGNHQGADLGEKCAFKTDRLKGQPGGTPRKEWRQQRCSFIEEFTTIGLCFPRYRAAEVQFYLARRAHKY